MGDSFPWENIISFLVEAFLFTAAWALTLGLIPYVIYHGRRWLVSIHRNARQQS